MSEINLSFWDIDRIQAEQDKHMSFKVTGVIPTVDTKQVECNLTELDNALDAYMRKVAEDTDMYIICEIAKLYIESQRPAEWCDDKCSVCGKGIEDLISSPEWYRNEEPNFCPFCGARVRRGDV